MDTHGRFWPANLGCKLTDTPMSQPGSRNLESPSRPEEKLESWKEIATYLGKGVTTVRRWEREEGLPVRRQEHVKRGSVIALKSELDAWRNSRTTLPQDHSTSPTWNLRWVAAVVFGVLLGVAGFLAFSLDDGNPEVQVQMLTAYPGSEESGSWAPGGQRFAFASKGSVYVRDVASEPSREIFHGENEPVCCLRWSPDGQQIAISYFQKTLPNWEIALIDPSGRVLRRLGDGGPDVTWSPDSRALLFSHHLAPSATWAIFERDLSTDRVRQVSFPPAGSWGDIAAVLDPSGRKLLVARFARFGQGDVYVADYGTSQAVRRTFLGNWVLGVDWLAGGRGIVFGGMVGEIQGIYRLRREGSSKPELIRGTEGINRYPQAIAFNAGSTRVSFVNEAWNLDLALFDPGTGRTTPVAVTTQSEESPDISSKGRLVYSSARGGPTNLWVCEPGCETSRQITHHSESHFDHTPRWSPDGSQIAYVAKIRGKLHLLVTDPQGRASRVLSTGTGEDAPSWSSDGRFIYFHSERSGRGEIWRIPASGDGSAVQMTTGGGKEAFESSDSSELFFVRADDNAELWRLPLAAGGSKTASGEAVLVNAIRVRRRTWRPVGKSVFYWTQAGTSAQPQLYNLDLESGKSGRITGLEENSKIHSSSVNEKGQVVWSHQKAREDDIKFVDLTFRPLWKRF